MRDPRERVRDILDAVAAIERYLHRGRAAFEQDELLQAWFVRNLQIIGEAARALPEEVRALAPEIEWTKIIGIRNVLVHGYFDVDFDIVWMPPVAMRRLSSLASNICCSFWRERHEGYGKHLRRSFQRHDRLEFAGLCMAVEWQECKWGDLATLEYVRALRDHAERKGRFRVFGTNGTLGWHDAVTRQLLSDDRALTGAGITPQRRVL